jgi:hypothetical protein
MIKREERKKTSRAGIFRKIWESAHQVDLPENLGLVARAAIPYLTEPWYC